MRFLLLLTLFSFSYFLEAAELKSRFKPVILKEFTTMKLKIMPDSGTQLIFPFELDNEDLTPRLKLRLTNDSGFWIPSSGDELSVLQGQNTLTILGLSGAYIDGQDLPEYLGNLFISIGGYNISIALKTTYNPKDVVSNIVFKLSDDDLTQMVEHQVKRRVVKLEQQYKDKSNALDRIAQKEALKHLAVMALAEPEVVSFKVDGNVEIGSDRIVINADELTIYDDTYFAITFDIENYSNVDYKVKEYRLKVISDVMETQVIGKFNCLKSIRGDAVLRCAFISMNPILKEAQNFKLEIETDRGTGVFQW